MFRPKSDSTFAIAAITCQGTPHVSFAACLHHLEVLGRDLVGVRLGHLVARDGRAEDRHQRRDGEGQRQHDGERQGHHELERVAAEIGEGECDEHACHHRPPVDVPLPP